MDGIKDIQDLLSQPMIRTIADADMQFLQGIANPLGRTVFFYYFILIKSFESKVELGY